MKTLEMDFLQRSLEEVLSSANQIRKDNLGTKLELCSIMNAKSGLCSEDCRFCAQSSRAKTGVSVYPLKSAAEMIAGAQEAKRIGAKKFGIVTSGNCLRSSEIDIVAAAIDAITSEVGIEVCASLGALESSELQLLKQSGLTRYHHNVETSPRFYPKVVTTHDFSERVKTIETAREVGLEICSGGIIGLGESWNDRIEMAELLKSLEVDSVPLNFLVPISGTPLEGTSPVSLEDALRTIAIFRIILEDKIIKIAAGRETILKDSQLAGFLAGANGMLIGGYLTLKGRAVSEDHFLVEEIKRAWAG